MRIFTKNVSRIKLNLILFTKFLSCSGEYVPPSVNGVEFFNNIGKYLWPVEDGRVTTPVLFFMGGIFTDCAEKVESVGSLYGKLLEIIKSI